NHPAEPRGVRTPIWLRGAADFLPSLESEFRTPHLQHRLVFLRDDIERGVALPDGGAVAQRCFKIKTEFVSVLGNAAPAALREDLTLHGNANLRQVRRAAFERGVNEFHEVPGLTQPRAAADEIIAAPAPSAPGKTR